ncbi:Dabb family protein [Ktedonosporobacter rubrisoli]|uniref:Dabb family protein n=1 Tax=Ktedonosporobacter rubrisoli TaxID=2509675 RepID=A0A4P6JL46_KTERU|nr:Dabb family protein [Ktedonosporobacter rubrisoli]QBD75918.1 Dabb family protein [Ktedonosporobacter rubrisoli]
MILHVVLLRPKPEVSLAQIQIALDHVKDLQHKVPGILEVDAGANKNESNNKGYTYGFAMRFVDETHLQAYAPHPEHRVVGAELVQLCESIIDFDLPL